MHRRPNAVPIYERFECRQVDVHRAAVVAGGSNGEAPDHDVSRATGVQRPAEIAQVLERRLAGL
jgi:hypothetical protein